MIDLRREGDVHVLRFDDGENRFSPDLLEELEKALDSLADEPAPKALVTTGTGKFYSNGLDLDWLGRNADQWGPYVARVHALFARLLTLPMPTVAAVNGHAFAAGGMLTLAHDLRVMRADRGYFCLPEVDLGLPFSPGMSALIQARLPKATAHEAMITGRRYGGGEALSAGIVDRTAPEAEVVSAAVALAAPLAAKDGGTIAKIRTQMYEPALAALA
ncbi:enoyl-CoA hydratase/isomerase family protein [Actinomadura sp. DC4]|uniref:enoyl-CoA hydratase/isomerase family protein n=1 Tax=Actinomadura sp. DC4 TaxID=3055069 RepID=UPI0025AFD7D4|nr:enoyl-CoA hydratase/isomerase family protein [Actinomadura sp. DC4]MDN3356542.1 enoyl-CoA hydratase/isomerase family protein [Actinomadura sp. DC4]